MSVPIVLRLGPAVLALVSLLLLVSLAVAPSFPDAGQLGLSATSRFDVLDVARGLRQPLLRTMVNLPQWSPDGEQILYIQQILQDATAFDRVKLAGIYQELDRLLYPDEAVTGNVEHAPVWSGETSQIALTFAQAGSDGLDLVVVEPHDGAIYTREVSDTLAQGSLLFWTPAGRLGLISVSRNAVRLEELATDNSAAPPREWPFRSRVARQPEPGPDGRFILPAITPESLNFELYLFDPRTEEVRNLSNRPVHNDTNPVWSPDGERILFRSLNDAGHFLVLMDADGSNQTTLHHESTALMSQVRWSPDGRRASFVVTRSGQKHLCVIEIASGEVDCPARDVDLALWRPG
ncbi:MAG TPA: hypothetical protein VKY59_11320 [Spirillospora sp.]|nr:hypothetical protein [Spirillospora sp.]